MSETQPLSNEQVEKWRQVLGLTIGSSAFVTPENAIQAFRDALQKRANLEEEHPRMTEAQFVAWLNEHLTDKCRCTVTGEHPAGGPYCVEGRVSGLLVLAVYEAMTKECLGDANDRTKKAFDGTNTHNYCGCSGIRRIPKDFEEKYALAGTIVGLTITIPGLEDAIAKVQQPDNPYLHVRHQRNIAWGEWVVEVFESEHPGQAAMEAVKKAIGGA